MILCVWNSALDATLLTVSVFYALIPIISLTLLPDHKRQGKA